MSEDTAVQSTKLKRRWKPYPEYKNPGIEWLQEVPTHWEVSVLKRAFNVQLGKMLQSTPTGTEDTLEPYLRAANISWHGVDLSDVKDMWFSPYEKKQYALEEGDLLISEGGDVGRSAIWKGELEHCYIQNAINRVRSKGLHSTHFLYYWIYTLKHSGYIDMFCSRATIPHFTAEKVECIHVLLPPVLEQHAITDFLNRETSKMDALIAKKGQLIELLQEKRIALISDAVTKGLDPNVAMKDSGLEWLREIPANWQVSRLKYLSKRITKGTTPTTLGKEFVDQGITFVKVESISDTLTVLEDSCAHIDEETHALLRRSQLDKDDVLIGIAGAIGRIAIVTEDLLPANTNQAVGIISLGQPNIVPRWIAYSLMSDGAQKHYGLATVQSAQENLSLEDVGSAFIPIPPPNEQRAIATFLDRETAKVYALIAKVGEAIDRLQEYRTTLISAAVTGKIDVREAAL